MHKVTFLRSLYNNFGICTISVSGILDDSLYLVLPFIGGNGGPKMLCDLLTSPTVMGLFRIQLSFITRTNLSLDGWLIFQFNRIASEAFLTSRFSKNFMLLDTVFKKEKACLSSFRSVWLESK